MSAQNKKIKTLLFSLLALIVILAASYLYLNILKQKDSEVDVSFVDSGAITAKLVPRSESVASGSSTTVDLKLSGSSFDANAFAFVINVDSDLNISNERFNISFPSNAENYSSIDVVNGNKIQIIAAVESSSSINISNNQTIASFDVSTSALGSHNLSFDKASDNRYPAVINSSLNDVLDNNLASSSIDFYQPNSPPTDISLSSTSISENAGDLRRVGSLTTTDSDSGDTHTYSLVSGSGDTNNSSFLISDTRLVAKSSFNYESKNNYSVRIQTIDSAGAKYAKAFNISVTNVNETPSISISLSKNTIMEGEDVRITASVNDPDNNISKVEFYRDSTIISTDSSSPYGYTNRYVSSGNYNYTAKVIDEGNLSATSSSVSLTVVGSSGEPTVNIISPEEGSTHSILHGEVLVKLDVSDPNGMEDIEKVIIDLGGIGTTLTSPPFEYSYTAWGGINWINVYVTDSNGNEAWDMVTYNFLNGRIDAQPGITSSDVMLVIDEIFGLDTERRDKMDLNLDGKVNFVDLSSVINLMK